MSSAAPALTGWLWRADAPAASRSAQVRRPAKKRRVPEKALSVFRRRGAWPLIGCMDAGRMQARCQSRSLCATHPSGCGSLLQGWRVVGAAQAHGDGWQVAAVCARVANPLWLHASPFAFPQTLAFLDAQPFSAPTPPNTHTPRRHIPGAANAQRSRPLPG
eukprot:358413-Chlamydomonas_euryale.AAC.25